MVSKLTPAESRIIIDKGTEPPFTGQYEKFFEEGIFVCRQCGLPLFDAQAKFDANCGWPAFEETFPLAVKETLDTDGSRTEITCARCGGHLGHVFRGEQFTEKDTRHCVNSLSIRFVPKSRQEEYMLKEENQLHSREIILRGGCFWCIEAAIIRVPGVLNVISGYAGGETGNPSYEEVCSGETGHAEVVKVIFDGGTLPREKVLDMFFKIHDPTTKDRQGNDFGTQYRSIIFYESDTEKDEITGYVKKKQEEYDEPIVTEIKKLEKFYEAEKYHQRYFEKNPHAGYCQAVVRPKVEKILREISVSKA
ncbi:bifunctional methionine sulfoxide reductase B/A protein [bacterium]|nr:bifunctional methionine sulfoxide reductase B/A protein [bacterium]